MSFCVCAPGHHDLKVALCSVYARASLVFTAEQYCNVRGLRCALPIAPVAPGSLLLSGLVLPCGLPCMSLSPAFCP